jgi:hypothetical protein
MLPRRDEGSFSSASCNSFASLSSPIQRSLRMSLTSWSGCRSSAVISRQVSFNSTFMNALPVLCSEFNDSPAIPDRRYSGIGTRRSAMIAISKALALSLPYVKFTASANVCCAAATRADLVRMLSWSRGGRTMVPIVAGAGIGAYTCHDMHVTKGAEAENNDAVLLWRHLSPGFAAVPLSSACRLGHVPSLARRDQRTIELSQACSVA